MPQRTSWLAIGFLFLVTPYGANADKKAAPQREARKDPKKVDKKHDERGHAKEAPVSEVSARRGFGRVRFSIVDHGRLERFEFAKKDWRRHFSRDNATVSEARKVAAQSDKILGTLAVDELARVLFVLDMEDKPAAERFRARLRDVVAEHGDLKVNIGPDVTLQAKFYHELYHLPCRAALRRTDRDWPPRYDCTEDPRPTTNEPTPFVKLNDKPTLLAVLPREAGHRDDESKGSASLGNDRKRLVRQYDGFALDIEKLGANEMPTDFCFEGKCHKTYRAVVAAIYGGDHSAGGYPVFCAAKKGADGKFERKKVHCTSSWLDTLGDYDPWTKTGEVAPAPKEGVIPDIACFGSPHLTDAHMVLPPGGEAGNSGFYCRRRIFRIMVKRPEKSMDDVLANIASMCAEMRQQVWGEKYPDINSEYQRWCHGPKGPKNKKTCLKEDAPTGGPGSPPIPFMLLTREEMMYFFGNRELFCRADRPGLVHFLFNKWTDTKTFTCNVPRGLIESGPFEEGVQTCALAPYAGREADGRIDDNTRKARLHCWKFDRPTCEDISNPEKAESKDSIHRSNVFDHYDALRQFIRTHNPETWNLWDMKDAEKLVDWGDFIAFNDGGGDEGVFGAKDFCRFDSNQQRLMCGYTKETIAHWFEMRKHEVPEGCGRGVCKRGAYQRGYYCALFKSREFFSGKPYWMCGVDVGLAGRNMINNAPAVCVGGRRSDGFQSPKGDRSSLQCFKRVFQWGESERSEDILRSWNWGDAVREAVRGHGIHYENWLHGGDEFYKLLRGLKAFRELPAEVRKKEGWWLWEHWVKKPNPQYVKARAALIGEAAVYLPGPGGAGIWAPPEIWWPTLNHAVSTARRELERDVKKDMDDLMRWAARAGHTLGHRTTMRYALIESDVPVIRELKRIRIQEDARHSYVPLGSDCKRAPCLQITFTPDGNEKAVERQMVDSLNALIQEVAKGERTPDRRWFEEFRNEATDDGQLRITPEVLAIILRVTHLFEVLDGARTILLRTAERYANAVFAAGERAPLMTRLEVHRRAREAAIPWRFKGNVYCVERSWDNRKMGKMICASSPLLVVGAIERFTRPFKSGGRSAAQIEKLRKEYAKFDWCYGGTEGQPSYGKAPSLAVVPDVENNSPYAMDLPPMVVEGGRATKDKEGKVKWVLPRDKNPKSKTNWLKCVGFAYSDEKPWDWVMKAAPESAKAKEGDDKESAQRKGEGKLSEGKDEMASKVGGLLGDIAKLGLGKFGDALERVTDLAHLSGEFLDKWVKALVDVAKAQWEKAKKSIEEAGEKVLKTRDEVVAKALDDFHKADVAVASAVGAAKQMAEDKKKAALDKLNDAKRLLRDNEKALDAVREIAAKKKVIEGSGEILNKMLEDLLKMVGERVASIVEPFARKLVNLVFGIVRKPLDLAIKAIVASLAAIPFGAGSALAAAAEIAYQAVMDELADAAVGALTGLVERLLSKMLRKVAGPIFKLAQNKVLKLAYGVCAALYPSACPSEGEMKFAALPEKDQWIDRALACEGPSFDEKMRRDAALAEVRIMRTLSGIEEKAPEYARAFANRHLARHGLDVNTWFAFASGKPEAVVLAKSREIERDIVAWTEAQKRARVKKVD